MDKRSLIKEIARQLLPPRVYGWGVTFGFAFLLTWAALRMVHLPWVLDEEDFFVTSPTKLKKAINKSSWFAQYFYDTNYIRDNFLIINTTRDQQLSIDANDRIRPRGDAGTPITNREKLSKLFKFLAENDTLYNIIVCDIFFQNSSSDGRVDDNLRKYIAELEAKEKIIFAISKAERYARSNMMKIQSQNAGLANVDAVEDYYLKQSLYDKTTQTKTLPLLMFERIHKINVSGDKHGLWTYNNGERTFRMYNSFIPEMLFTRADFDNLRSNTNYAEFDSTMAICDLGAALREPDGLNLYGLLDKESAVKKTVIIGAIMGRHGDVHKTLYGMLDGPIILINAYHCIYLGYNRYSFLYLVVLFATFLLISYRIIFHKEKDIAPKTIGGFLLTKLKDRTYYLGLLLLTLISYFFFNHTTNVAVLVIAFEFLHALVRLARNYQVIEKSAVPNPNKHGTRGAATDLPVKQEAQKVPEVL